MADKIKKISINAFEKAIDEQYEPIRNIEWNGITVTIKYNLTLREMLSFVDSVVKNCFKEEDGAYMPEIKDFAIRNCIIEYYTNISLPSNIEKRYDLIYRQSLIEEIISSIDTLQFNSLVRSIDDKVSHLAQTNIETVTKQMNELYISFDSIQKQIEEFFSEFDKDSLSGVINALSSGVIDEEKIAKAVLSQQRKNGDEK